MSVYRFDNMVCQIESHGRTLIIALEGSFQKNVFSLIRHVLQQDPEFTQGIPAMKYDGFVFDLSRVTEIGRELEVFLSTLSQKCQMLVEKRGTLCGVFGENRATLEFLRTFGYQQGVWASRDLAGAQLICHARTIRCVRKTPCSDYTVGDIYEFDLKRGPPTIFVQRTGKNAGVCGRTTILQPAELLHYFEVEEFVLGVI